MKTIIVSGSVGSGKTTISKKLVKSLKSDYINITEFVKKNKIGKYNKKYNSYEVDIKKLNTKLIKIIKEHKKLNKNLIIDGHLSHFLPRKYVDLGIICKCDIKKLKKRLEKRKYSKNKIRENLDVEIFDIPLIEARKKKHKIKIINT
ncbi:MAG: AAA family ATPase [Nanoarchaeota archaeon]|nr:AAA family ATPase [Nanoarchaeota archaeon]MBU0963246.1 AAA family ATPase [Nanoarchaeota archaeon]